MAEQKKEEFYALLREYEALVASLSPEEKVALEVTSDPEEDVKYKNQFFLLKCKTDADHLRQAQEAVDHCRGMLESLRKDTKAYRAKMQRKTDGVTPVKLLARYLKLPEYWRAFIGKGLHLDGTEIGEVDTSMRDLIAELIDDDDKNEKMFIACLERIANLVTECEEVAITVPAK